MRNPHLIAIQSREVTATNVIGIRKAINTLARKAAGFRASPTASKMTAAELNQIERELTRCAPRVVGSLHDTGVKLLTSPRYRKRLAPVREIIDGLVSFHLVGFDRLGRYEDHAVPVYEVRSPTGAFRFRNIPWQSGGNGPEVIQ